MLEPQIEERLTVDSGVQERSSIGAYYFYEPWFLRQLRQRNDLEKNTLAAYTGKPGRGKSVAGLSTCGALDPTFSVDQIVFNGSQFKKAIEVTKPYSWILWDEPNKGLSHRNWYTDLNKTVTVFLQTSRFRLKNVIFALPKLELLDKSARPVLLFEGIFWTRGVCSIYELEPNHFGSTPELFKNFQGEVEFRLPSRELWRAYEDKREEWHRKEFPEEEFGGQPEPPSGDAAARKYKNWLDVLAHVKADPVRYTDSDKGRITALKVAALESCSDQTARKVIEKYLADLRDSSTSNA